MQFLCVIGFGILASLIVFGGVGAIIKEFHFTGFFFLSLILVGLNIWIDTVGEKDGRPASQIIGMTAGADVFALILIGLFFVVTILDGGKK